MAESSLDLENIAEGEALKSSVESARAIIEREMGNMAQSTTNAAGEVGMVKSLWNVMQERRGEMKELVWKDLKATAAGALAVIPLVGNAAEVGTIPKIVSAAEKGKAALSAEKAFKSTSVIGDVGDAAFASQNTARSEFWKALKNVPRNPVHLVSDPLRSGKEAWAARGTLKGVEKTARGVTGSDPIAQANRTVLDSIGSMRRAEYGAAKRQLGKDVLVSGGLHLMRSIDPFPDVPQPLVTVAGLANFVLPGADIVPAIWQLGHNKIEWAKMYGGMALDMGKVVINRFDRKLTGMKEPQVARAAGAFSHG